MRRKLSEKKVLGIIAIAIGAVALFGFIVMTLWNNVLAKVTNVRLVSFGQALGILVLSKILFGGFRGGGWRGRPGIWRHEMKEKWNEMTPEEQEKFRSNRRNRCSSWNRSTPAQEPTAEEKA